MQIGFTNDISSATVISTNGTTARKVSDRLAETINVKDLGAKGDGVTDDSFALANAISLATTLYANSSGATRPIIRLPAGAYYITNNFPSSFMTYPISFRGDGSDRTFISVDPGFSGDVFAWSECWQKSAFPVPNSSVGGISSLGSSYPNIICEGMTISGNTLSNNIQNAFMFYNRNDQVSLDDINVYYMNGRGLGAGMVPNTGYVTQSYIRESQFFRFRTYFCGANNIPSVEFLATGSGDRTNEIKVYQMDIFGSLGPGLVLRANTVNIDTMDFFGLRVEGFGSRTGGSNNYTSNGDLIQIGDKNYSGIPNNIRFYGFHAFASLQNNYAIGFYANSVSNQPYYITMFGSLGTPQGNSINIQSGRGLKFSLQTPTNCNVSIANSQTVGTDIQFDLNGGETLVNWSVDSTVANSIIFPAMINGIPGNTVTLASTFKSFANGASTQTATLTNAPTAGNPTKWVPINDNGTTRYIPAW